MTDRASRTSGDEAITTRLGEPPRMIGSASLFLDFDGTLAEIARTPDAVIVEPRIREIITALTKQLEGRLAIVSGRSIAEIDRFIGLPDLAVSGSHGLEMRWPDGRREMPEPPSGLSSIIAALRRFANDHPGVIVEEKPFGAGLHYRATPDIELSARQLTEYLAAEQGLDLQAGKMVFEIRLPGRHKGDAIREFMAGSSFADGAPWFAGDDITDENGFVAVADLGGFGVLVGAERSTAAAYRLPDVPATHRWLDAILENAE